MVAVVIVRTEWSRRRAMMPAAWSPFLIAPAAIPAWRSYRAVCAAVAVGVCWRSSMPDAVRHLQEPADVLGVYGCP